MFWGRKRRERELADAREEALRWYERLGGQIMNLPKRDDPAIQQALVDAGERYNAAGAQLDRATTPAQYGLARETAVEGLAYIRAARVAMGFDPGPDIPPLAGQRQAGQITQENEVQIEGRPFRASPRHSNRTPYYYPGGMVQGRPVPGGWYSEPWWKTALVAGAWGVGSFLIMDALFSPGLFGWDGGGFAAGHDDGFQDGLDYAEDHGWDPGGEQDAAADAGGGDFGGYDYGSDYAGDFGGGDFGGGDFGGF
ncbi:hypothetical protein [Luedemannella helvata]|uniref:DUF2076 domain-containing protein n=1 Tax=Luedemannella helvata TaxID=349315 RepID=A0ABN2JPH7_9ACTN